MDTDTDTDRRRRRRRRRFIIMLVLEELWVRYIDTAQNSKLFRSRTKQAENGAVSKLNNHSDLHTLKTSHHTTQHSTAHTHTLESGEGEDEHPSRLIIISSQCVRFINLYLFLFCLRHPSTTQSIRN